LCFHPVAVVQYTFTHKQYIEQHKKQQNNTNNNQFGGVRTVPRLSEFYPGICLTTEEKARINLSQGKKNLSQSTVYILPKHPHITKQYNTTTVQIKTNTVQDIPK
jgi:hypothetical protein